MNPLVDIMYLAEPFNSVAINWEKFKPVCKKVVY